MSYKSVRSHALQAQPQSLYRASLDSFISHIRIYTNDSPLELNTTQNSAHFISHLRHLPNMFPHQSHAPSRLNPSFPSSADLSAFPSPPAAVAGGRFGIKGKVPFGQGYGRGTVSMPTSPLGTSLNNEPMWDGVGYSF